LPYFHVVFTLPAVIADIAFQNKRVVYNLRSRPRPRRCSRSPSIPSIWARTSLSPRCSTRALSGEVAAGSPPGKRANYERPAMTLHPHVHMIVPGGGISVDGERWVTCRPSFFLAVRVLSKLFRRLMIEKLMAAHATGRLTSSARRPVSPMPGRSPPS
jgi:hypothetical protein